MENTPTTRHCVPFIIAAPFCIIGAWKTLALISLFSGKPFAEMATSWPRMTGSWLFLTMGVIIPLVLIAQFALARRSPREGGERLFQFLMDKLPARLRTGQILAIKAEDHYVRIFTSQGDDLVLMRFQDAVTAVEAIPGVRTHRSWWVAAGAIDRIETLKNGARIVLTSGVEAPLSKRRRQELRDQHGLEAPAR